ncbi:hypothetical protein OHT57_23955 [Streptomyces sp. NBC_00285]|uniref:hypothetical protein n=1 Tax=Streptomyces sp. NBC_00285 TaxID=2975700 RepID=UPI002E2AD641|nr:hypothetical protein [Streptomyces sp. NBC_00285]
MRRRNGPRDVRRRPGDASPRSAPARAGSDQQYTDATALTALLTSALLNGARRGGDVARLGVAVEPPSVLRLRAHAYSSERPLREIAADVVAAGCASFRTYARARHLRLSDLAARIITGDLDTTVIPAPATARPGDHHG